MLSRRDFLRNSGALGILLSTPSVFALEQPNSVSSGSKPIDRSAIVRRHNPVVTSFDPFSSLSLGNGETAFTADFTGLQTFADECEKKFPLCTASHWSWHTTPAPGLRREDFRYKDYDTYGRPVGYATSSKGQEELFNWLRQNPHRLHLGRIGFELNLPNGESAKPQDLTNIHQSLDLWSGVLDSSFHFLDQPVRVQTCFHPELDLLAVRVESSLLSQAKLKVRFAFPYGSPELGMADWQSSARHITKVEKLTSTGAILRRKLDETEYFVGLSWSVGSAFEQCSRHEFLLGSDPRGPAARPRTLEFVCVFSPQSFSHGLPNFTKTSAASAAHWRSFWEHGGAIDLGASSAPKAQELERRIVLSLYQTAIHCAGSLPSAETGLLSNSWYGKFHLEMHWWHSVHFAAWNRFPLFQRSLSIYQRILPLACKNAERQGYRGARWPKMIGPDGQDSPSPVGPLLIWQQPHPIYYAELSYRQRPHRQTLEQWKDIVFKTAEFMASLAVLDKGQFVLGPPLKTVSENTDQLTTRNPTFELAYWRFGLRTAQNWRERLGLGHDPVWDHVLNHLSPLPAADNCYLLQEGLSDTYTNWNWEHPALVGALGMQPGDGVDHQTMCCTVRRVMETWHWERSWGWDFPLTAMCAARVGEPELAVKALLMDEPKNRYWPNGHNYQRENLTAYLPGNGGLLSAIAMMAAGWTGAPSAHAPGFPADGKWSVSFENLKQWL